ncbi:sensor domain-containing phosphodiesterase [Methylobacterium sp. JK268]
MPLPSLFEMAPGSAGKQIQSILSAARRHLAMDVGFVSEFVRGDRVFRFADGDTARNPVVLGKADPLEESYCYYVARGLMPGVLPDAARDPVAARLSATRNVPVGAHLSVPLRLADGAVFGTLCCFSFTADHRLSARDLGTLRLCAEVIVSIVEKERGDFLRREAQRARVAAILADRAVTMAFQPFYRVPDGQLTGFEALARFDAEPARPPDAWFADAAEVGLGAELEFLAVERALEALPVLDPSLKVTVNLSPASILSPLFGASFAGMPLDRLVIEMTEHAAVPCYDALNAVLAPMRERGLRLAIDDVGAGHATLRHVLDLAPDFIKIDRSLISRIDSDSARQALVEALTLYSRRMGCEVVAEGVETRAEYAVLREIGVTRLQGYLLGRPMPLGAAARLDAHWRDRAH